MLRQSARQLAAHAQQVLADEGLVFDDQDAHGSSIRPHQPVSSGLCAKRQPPGEAAARLASI